MSMHDDEVSLRDMLNHAREARDLVAEMTREEFRQRRVLQLALTRLIEIVGEAANRVSRSTQQAYATIPWPSIIGMRHRLIHGYDVTDYDLVWDTVANDFPPLIETLERILE